MKYTTYRFTVTHQNYEQGNASRPGVEAGVEASEAAARGQAGRAAAAGAVGARGAGLRALLAAHDELAAALAGNSALLATLDHLTHQLQP